MIEIRGRNVNHTLATAIVMFASEHQVRRIAPRGAATLELKEPVATTYENPMERVLFHTQRDANPFFHFFESLWILAQRQDVAFLQFFLGNIKKFSDHGDVFHGAYGDRMRAYEQINNAIRELKRDPATRRAVLALWQPVRDSGYTGVDMPCNVAVTFKIREDQLNMTVFNRSNDMIWGAYGANVVQFATLLEYMAGMVGVKPGSYVQISDSFHVYETEPAWLRTRDAGVYVRDPYTENEGGPVCHYPMVTKPGTFTQDLVRFMRIIDELTHEDGHPRAMDAAQGFDNDYFDHVARPLFNAYVAYKNGEIGLAMRWNTFCLASDWKLAVQEWLQRRIARRAAAPDSVTG